MIYSFLINSIKYNLMEKYFFFFRLNESQIKPKMQVFSIKLTHALFITILSRVFAIAALIMLVTLDRSARIVLPVVFIAALLWVSGKGKNKQVIKYTYYVFLLLFYLVAAAAPVIYIISFIGHGHFHSEDISLCGIYLASSAFFYLTGKSLYILYKLDPNQNQPIKKKKNRKNKSTEKKNNICQRCKQCMENPTEKTVEDINTIVEIK